MEEFESVKNDLKNELKWKRIKRTRMHRMYIHNKQKYETYPK